MKKLHILSLLLIVLSNCSIAQKIKTYNSNNFLFKLYIDSSLKNGGYSYDCSVISIENFQKNNLKNKMVISVDIYNDIQSIRVPQPKSARFSTLDSSYNDCYFEVQEKVGQNYISFEPNLLEPTILLRRKIFRLSRSKIVRYVCDLGDFYNFNIGTTYRVKATFKLSNYNPNFTNLESTWFEFTF